MHKLAVVWWVGGMLVLRADLVLVAILVKSDPARNFERPPSHPALCSQRVQLTLGAIGSASVQQRLNKRYPIWVGGRVSLHSLCRVCLMKSCFFDSPDVSLVTAPVVNESPSRFFMTYVALLPNSSTLLLLLDDVSSSCALDCLLLSVQSWLCLRCFRTLLSWWTMLFIKSALRSFAEHVRAALRPQHH